MKFTYQYRTSDNVSHSGTINAASKDAAFAALKARGIRPGRVEVAPGFFNLLFGVGKRWIAIGVLAVALVGALCWAVVVAGDAVVDKEEGEVVGFLSSPTRRQIIGDSAIIEKGIRTGWSSVFADEGERFFASFAIPGVPAGQRNTTEDEIRAALAREVIPTDGDGIEERQIKSMVEGMKRELRNYLSAGGTIVSYGQRLVERQEAEIAYYARAKAELDAAAQSDMPEDDLVALWEKRNDELRRMGVRLLQFPE